MNELRSCSGERRKKKRLIQGYSRKPNLKRGCSQVKLCGNGCGKMELDKHRNGVYVLEDRDNEGQEERKFSAESKGVVFREK